MRPQVISSAKPSTPLQKQQEFDISFGSKSDSDPFDEMDGDTYIKQYYKEKYGTTRKGFSSRLQLTRKQSLDQKSMTRGALERTADRKPLQHCRSILNNRFKQSSLNPEDSPLQEENKQRFKSPQGSFLLKKKLENQGSQNTASLLF